ILRGGFSLSRAKAVFIPPAKLVVVARSSYPMQCRAVRRPPGIDLFKNNTSADYAQSSAARI
ncbi:MAG: hypothetical protein U0M83_02060, partial [Faecalibacterium prausnitzii]